MSPERRGDPSPEHSKQPYYHAVRFAREGPAALVYAAAQRTIHDRRTACDLSTYRMLLDGVWHVAVLGEQPAEDIENQLSEILSAGDPVQLPEEVVAALTERREQAKKLAPWVERHVRPPRRI